MHQYTGQDKWLFFLLYIISSDIFSLHIYCHCQYIYEQVVGIAFAMLLVMLRANVSQCVPRGIRFILSLISLRTYVRRRRP